VKPMKHHKGGASYIGLRTSLLAHVQTSSGAYPVSISKGTRGLLPR
jgi:hypothetical protein